MHHGESEGKESPMGDCRRRQGRERLDNFLSSQLKGAKGRIYKMIRTGEVRINKKRCKPDSRVSGGDVVRIPPVDLEVPRSRLPIAVFR